MGFRSLIFWLLSLRQLTLSCAYWLSRLGTATRRTLLVIEPVGSATLAAAAIVASTPAKSDAAEVSCTMMKSATSALATALANQASKVAGSRCSCEQPVPQASCVQGITTASRVKPAASSLLSIMVAVARVGSCRQPLRRPTKTLEFGWQCAAARDVRSHHGSLCILTESDASFKHWTTTASSSALTQVRIDDASSLPWTYERTVCSLL